MSNFPKLIPAFTVFIVLEPRLAVGQVSTTGPLILASFASNSGSFVSEPSYPTKVDATFVHGSDYIRQDASAKHVRLDVHSLLKDKSGALIKLSYKGIIEVDAATGAVLNDADDAKTTEFGGAFTHVTFETGNSELKMLEEKVFVASGRFVVESGKPLTVEYKISQVVAG